MIRKILILLSVMLFLVGCQTSEVPPSPDSPGGVAGEYTVATDELGDWANEAVTFSVTPDMAEIGIDDSYVLEIEDSFIWSTYYVYSYNLNEWLEFSFPSNTYRDSGWIKDEFRVDNFLVTENLIGENIVAVYSCTRIESGWDCHGGWQVEGLTILEGIPDAPGAIGEIDGEVCCLETIYGDFCRDVQASECIVGAPGSQDCNELYECAILGCCTGSDGGLLTSSQGDLLVSQYECGASDGNWAEGNIEGGVCVEIDDVGENELLTYSCVDSDGGKDYDTLGTVEFRGYDESGDLRILGDPSDWCVLANWDDEEESLREYYCDSNNKSQYEHVTCPNGCSDGVCVEY